MFFWKFEKYAKYVPSNSRPTLSLGPLLALLLLVKLTLRM